MKIYIYFNEHNSAFYRSRILQMGNFKRRKSSDLIIWSVSTDPNTVYSQLNGNVFVKSLTDDARKYSILVYTGCDTSDKTTFD